MLQLVCGSFVADDDGMGMHLQGANRPFLADGTFDSVLQGTSLVVTVHDDEHFLCVHHGSDTDRQGRLWHLVHIVLEEAAVGDDSVCGETLHASAAR